MERNNVVALAQYKAEHLSAQEVRLNAAEPEFPSADRLWELLDRNISLSIWQKEH